MPLSSSPTTHSQPHSSPPLISTQPSVLAWQGSPDHALRAQILAAARERPQAVYPTQRPPSPQPPAAVPQQLRPRRSASAKAHSGSGSGSGGTSSSSRRPRHNAHSSVGSMSTLTSSSSVTALAGASSLLSAWSTNSLAAASTTPFGAHLPDKTAGARPVAKDLARSTINAPDENRWDLAQILSEVDARVAARRRPPSGTAMASTTTTAAATVAAAALTGGKVSKGKARTKLQRSVSVDRLPVGSSSARARAAIGKPRPDLADVVEHPHLTNRSQTRWDADLPASKRLKRSTSSYTALMGGGGSDARRRARSPSWEVEDHKSSPSSGAAYDDGMDWDQTLDLLSTPPPPPTSIGKRTAPPAATTNVQPVAVAPPPFAIAPHVQPPPTKTRSSPQQKTSPLKRKLPNAPSPLKQTTSASDSARADGGTDTQAASTAPSQTRAGSQPSSGSVGARLGMGRSTTTGSGASGGGRVPRFRPPFKPPSQSPVAAVAQPVANAAASKNPPVSTRSRASPSRVAGEMDDQSSTVAVEDTSFDSFDGMFAALQGSGEFDEVLRLVDGR